MRVTVNTSFSGLHITDVILLRSNNWVREEVANNLVLSFQLVLDSKLDLDTAVASRTHAAVRVHLCWFSLADPGPPAITTICKAIHTK